MNHGAPAQPPAEGPVEVQETIGGRGHAEAAALQRLHARAVAPGLERRGVTHGRFWDVVGPVLSGSAGLRSEEVGRSYLGRPLRLVRFGSGSTRVLLWSQMHGDENTGTRALADLLRLLATAPEEPLVRRVAAGTTLLVLPMLNPDGAEHDRRRNAQGLDLNRDARTLAAPETRTLAELLEREAPRFALDLHDEDALKRVGETDRQALVSLQAPVSREGQPAREAPARSRALAATIVRAVAPLAGGHVARYPVAYAPWTFGTSMAERGIDSVLFETSGAPDDPRKDRLRTICFVGILAALDAVATGDVAESDTFPYDDLPTNTEAMLDLVVTGGMLVLPGREPYRAELAVTFGDPLERRGGRISDVGDLRGRIAFERVDAEGLWIHPLGAALEQVDPTTTHLAVDRPASFIARRGPGTDAAVAWIMDEGRIVT